MQTTSTARGSSLTAEVLIPFLQKQRAILRYEAVQFRQFSAAKSIVGGKADGLQPKFGVAFGLFDMNVGRLAPFVAEEEESIASDSQDGRHSFKLRHRRAVGYSGAISAFEWAGERYQAIRDLDSTKQSDHSLAELHRRLLSAQRPS